MKANAISYLREEVYDFAQEYKSQKWTWETPGRNSSPADPGKLNALIDTGKEKITIDTSLDSISSPSNEISRGLQRLVKIIRGSSGTPPCGNKQFYGLTSLNND